MKSCASCRRHLRRAERTCPFCGVPVEDAVAPWVAVLSLASLLTGCTDGPPSESADTSGAESTVTSMSGSGMVDTSTTQSSTTAVDSDDTVADTSSGGGFIYGVPDEGGTPGCDLFAQDCPAGQKCASWANDGGQAWNATRCVPIADDPAGPGEPCVAEGGGLTGVDDCELGAMCWDVDPATNMGTCVAQCTGSEQDPMCEVAGTTCVIANDGAIANCLPTCDPLGQDCPEGQACVSYEESFICAPDTGQGLGQYGDECDQIATCNPGLLCVAAMAVPGCMSTGCCTELCSLSDPMGDAQCAGQPMGQQCQLLYPMDPPPEFADLGYCTL